MTDSAMRPDQILRSHPVAGIARVHQVECNRRRGSYKPAVVRAGCQDLDVRPDLIRHNPENDRTERVLDCRNDRGEPVMNSLRHVEVQLSALSLKKLTVEDGSDHSAFDGAKITDEVCSVSHAHRVALDRTAVPISTDIREIDVVGVDRLPSPTLPQRAAAPVRDLSPSCDRITRNGPCVAEPDSGKVAGNNELPNTLRGHTQQLRGVRKRNEIWGHS